ncbi:uncharacterized protein LOC103575243 [Microplitis demolitor]|uniref:uncharacterized protein LOC103575243 n=1 Tax=Microplitis demolitor TaxID=69319 RepID=UPI0004CD1449|nr:uncharacterized protein LOC103575243 [Microplitis demolitor]
MWVKLTVRGTYKWIDNLDDSVVTYNDTKRRSLRLMTKYKHVFEKGYDLNWTSKIFTIKEVKNNNPTTYELIDYQDKPIDGGFYEEELIKVEYLDIYLVEKIIRTCGKKLYVKWLKFE